MELKMTETFEAAKSEEGPVAVVPANIGAFNTSQVVPPLPRLESTEDSTMPDEDDEMFTDVQCAIVAECEALKERLIAKNASYGNSALDPVRIFSKASVIEQILVRLDDKLSRLARGDFAALPTETKVDTVDDILGYLILLKVSFREWFGVDLVEETTEPQPASQEDVR
jgi:hypothetical protein